jgi:hypothetical protein
MRHLAAVAVPDLIRWAAQIDDEIGLDEVAAMLRAAGSDPGADVVAIIHRVRDSAATCDGCAGRRRCSYHEGWNDVLDLLEEAFS